MSIRHSVPCPERSKCCTFSDTNFEYDTVQTAVSGVPGTKGLSDVVTFRSLKGGWMGPTAGMDINGREKNISPLPGIEPLFVGCQTGNLVAIQTELSQNFVE
jgi:hypothetical protein